jgi:nicotinate phosphoribosyltransferase
MDSAARLPGPFSMQPGVLLTDLYALTMLAAYHAQRMNGVAVFELFVRALPPGRGFLMAAGLAQVVEYLTSLRFTARELAFLERSGRFTPEFCRSLTDLRFTGDLEAMPEGTVFFADEPILRVTAPLREAQLVETRLMNLAHYATLAASKAARCVLAAPSRLLVDFGLRRAHGAEAGLVSARAAYIAGFTGTATVDAGRRFGIPIFGTMAHSYVQAHADETTAFASFARSQPDNAVLLIDTYDTERGAHRVVALARELASEGIAIKGVRIDSGDLAVHSRRVRAILDAGGCHALTIFASGNLDEFRLRDLAAAGAPIDGFGVGTRMNTSADAPFLDCAYKLEEYDGVARRKRSAGKATWPGRKQVFRREAADGTFTEDVVSLADAREAGRPLLVPVLRGGQPVRPLPSLTAIREHARRELAALPLPVRALEGAVAYPVTIAPAVVALAADVDART